MSRSSLKTLRSAFVLRDLITQIRGGQVIPRARAPTSGPRNARFVPFLSSVRASRPDEHSRLSSTKSTGEPPNEAPAMKAQSGTAVGGQDSPDTVKTEANVAPTGTAESAETRVDHMKEQSPAKKADRSENRNVTAERSRLVEDDIKKQLKRLTDLLDGFSGDGSSRKEGFTFHQQLRQGTFTPLWTWITEPMRYVEAIFNAFYGRMIKSIVDMEFDIYEFLEGAKDAFYMVNKLFADADYETLKPMVSTKLFENMKITTEQFQKEGLQFTVSPENIIGAYVSGLKIVKAKALTTFGPEFDIPELTDGKENFWVLIYVRFTRNEHYKLFRTTGEVIQDTMSLRRDLWTFVRGPINVLPMQEDCPGWILLSIA